jgi:ubiquinone/menaquinone biosynthesis C-methylase UbiE
MENASPQILPNALAASSLIAVKPSKAKGHFNWRTGWHWKQFRGREQPARHRRNIDGVAAASRAERFPFSADKVQLKKEVRKFWEKNPCDSWFTKEERGTREFYKSLDEHRYTVHPRLLRALELEQMRGKRVLEIGCGCGSEAERFARAGAEYTAVDLTKAAPTITRQRFKLAGLSGRFVQGDAENLPFADGSFDVVYSHGVLHHTPDTPRTIREVYRVLANGGRAMIMLYYRNSFNYQVNLKMFRRIRAHLLKTEMGIKLSALFCGETEEALRQHAAIIKENTGAYLDMQNMLNRNTDGADNPLSQVFTKESSLEMFRGFQKTRTEVMFWNPNWLPGIGKLLPRSIEDKLAARWGWHLWIHAQKQESKKPVERECAASNSDAMITLGALDVRPWD